MSISSRDRLEQALSKIADPAGEGSRACLTIYADAARQAADAADARARLGITLGPLDGAILTIKDMFDVAGERTRAGSKILADEGEPAKTDAPIVTRLRRAGAVIVAKANMTEFAFSALGMNPHYGTPGNPADRKRVPGGSTSGGAVGVADGMCEITIGSDTGGSTRIPAALCGITGFKPSKYRIPTEGAFPLSDSLDSVGPMGRNVADCANADAIMAGEEPQEIVARAPRSIRFSIAQGLPLKNMDETVSARFSEALTALGKAGVQLNEEPLGLLDDMAAILRDGWLPPVEGHVVHRDRLKRRAADFDPRIRGRLEAAASRPAVDYFATLQKRAALVREMHEQLADCDGLVMPTTPIVAPLMADMEDPEAFTRANLLLLQNTAIANFFDLCAISLPLPRQGGLPVGLMIVGRNGDDHKLFRVAAAVEKILAA